MARRADLDWCRKSLPATEFDPRTVQPVASRYTYCAIPARMMELLIIGK